MSEQEIRIRIIKILANNADEPQNTVDAIMNLILTINAGEHERKLTKWN